MDKNLPVIKQNSQVALAKSKKLLGVTEKILANKISLPENADDWVNRLWKWADEHDIDLPKERVQLVQLTELDLNLENLEEIPKEIGNLTQLTELNLGLNLLKELSKEIGNLTQLEILDLDASNLRILPDEICNLSKLTRLCLPTTVTLSARQNKWIDSLKCEVSGYKILANKISLPEKSDDWMYRLWKWADEYQIDLPKERDQLVQLTKLEIISNSLRELPKGGCK